MTLKETKKAVADIRASLERSRFAHEECHCAEDSLYLDLLKSIAEGTCEDPQACAKEPIKTQKIDFQRWAA